MRLLLLTLLGCPKCAPVGPFAETVRDVEGEPEEDAALDDEPAAEPTGGDSGSGATTGMGGGGGMGIELSTRPKPVERGDIEVDPEASAVVQLVQKAVRGDGAIPRDEAAMAVVAAGGWTSDGGVGDLWRAIDDNCQDLVWSEGGGYGAIAVPPPMNDDTQATAKAAEATIELLQGTTEVSTSCSVHDHVEECWDATPDMEAGCEVFDEQYDKSLFAVALHEVDGQWKVVGWRDFSVENPLGH